MPNPKSRHNPLKQSPQDAPYPYIHFEDHERLPLRPRHLETDVGNAHDFPAVYVDNLLVEKIALDAQHVLVRVIRIELFVAELDTVQRNGGNLVVTDRKPGRSRAHQIAVDPSGMNERDHGGVPDAADAPMLQVEDRQAQKIGEVEKVFRHALAHRTERESPHKSSGEAETPNLGALYIGFGRLISICPKATKEAREMRDRYTRLQPRLLCPCRTRLKVACACLLFDLNRKRHHPEHAAAYPNAQDRKSVV